MHAPTFLWHDFETFGTSPQKDLPCQFAAVRTDMDLNVIGKPINIMSAIANDYLPHPEACLVTGITPQQTKHIVSLTSQHRSKSNICMNA